MEVVSSVGRKRKRRKRKGMVAVPRTSARSSLRDERQYVVRIGVRVPAWNSGRKKERRGNGFAVTAI